MKRISLIIISAGLVLAACTKFSDGGPCLSASDADGGYTFNVSCEEVEGEVQTKSAYTNAALTKVSNVNIFVYSDGYLSDSYYFSSGSGLSVQFPVADATYNVYMLANVGKITAPGDESNLGDLVYTFSNYSSFQTNGFPMANSFIDYTPGSQTSFKLKRLIGMYSISMENSSDVVDYNIKSLQMRNCAKDIYPFGDTAASSFLSQGDYLTSSDLATLNSGGAVTVYFLENLQGELLPGNTDPKQKIPDNLQGSVSQRCTYLQIMADVTTSTAHFDNIYYRVYLGRNMTTDFSIVRSTLYNLELDFASNLIAEEGWRIEPEDPEILGAINLSKNTAKVIKGIDDVIFVTTKSANGSPVDFDIKLDSGASAAGLSYTTYNTTYHGKSAKAIKFTTSKAIDGLCSYNVAPENYMDKVKVTLSSKDKFNGVPTITKTATVNVYRKAFPIYFKARMSGSYWYLYAYSNNPMGLSFRFDYKTYNGQDCSTVKRSDWNRFQRFSMDENFWDDDGADWTMYDYAISRNGSQIGCLGMVSDYPDGMRLDITVTPVSDSNFGTAYSNDQFLEYPKFASGQTAYMGSGTTAYFGPGSNLYPARFSDYPSDYAYNFDISGAPTATSYTGFSTSFVSQGYNFLMNSGCTGWNRQDSYSLSNFGNGFPFYFVNGGLTCYERVAFMEEPNYLDDSARIGVEVHAYEPGRDLGMITSTHSNFGFKIGTMTQFFGNNHSWQAWKSYDYGIYMTINGCTSWPGASYSSTGFYPGMYTDEPIEWD